MKQNRREFLKAVGKGGIALGMIFAFPAALVFGPLHRKAKGGAPIADPKDLEIEWDKPRPHYMWQTEEFKNRKIEVNGDKIDNKAWWFKHNGSHYNRRFWKETSPPREYSASEIKEFDRIFGTLHRDFKDRRII